MHGPVEFSGKVAQQLYERWNIMKARKIDYLFDSTTRAENSAVLVFKSHTIRVPSSPPAAARLAASFSATQRTAPSISESTARGSERTKPPPLSACAGPRISHSFTEESREPVSRYLLLQEREPDDEAQ
jgi:hypothetical protein